MSVYVHTMCSRYSTKVLELLSSNQSVGMCVDDAGLVIANVADGADDRLAFRPLARPPALTSIASLPTSVRPYIKLS